MQSKLAAVFLIALVDLGAVLGTVAHAQNEKAKPAAAVVQAPQLPEPQGPYAVGRIGFDWIDTSRPSSCYRKSRDGREMAVYLWYPSSLPPAESRGTYLPHARAVDAISADRKAAIDIFGSHWEQIVDGGVDSHAVENAPVAIGRNIFPIILFSHGMSGSQFSYTSLIEGFVSRGYIVAGIEHPCSTDLTVFPGGRIVRREEEPAPAGQDSQPSLQQMMASALEGIAQGAADDRFVLDRLTDLNKGDAGSFALAGRLDLMQVAAMGHSAGGAFAARACQLDARIRACIDLEGQLIPVELFPDFSDGAKFKQPVLMMEISRGDSAMGGTRAEHEEYSRKREAQLSDCPPGSYYVSLQEPGFAHSTFSDGPLLNAPEEPVHAQAEARLASIEKLANAFLRQSFSHIQTPTLAQVSATGSDMIIRPLGQTQ